MLAAATLTLPLLLSGVSAPEITFLPSGYFALGVSDDGSVIVGLWPGGAYRWTEADGYLLISDVAQGSSVAISGDGEVLGAEVVDANGKMHAALWVGGLGGDDWQELPADPPDFASCDAFLLGMAQLNQNGDVAVGLGWVPGCRAHGYRWSPTTGTVDLGSTVVDRSSSARAVDGSGNLIAGWQDTAFGDRLGAKWTWSDETMSAVQTPIPKYVSPGGASYDVGQASAVSNDGSMILGVGIFGLAGGNAWIWNAGTDKTTLLPTIFGASGTNAIPFALNADASVIVGSTGGPPFGRKALIWFDGVPQNLKTYLTSLGVDVPYTELGNAYDVSADGRTIVGTGAGIGQPWGWVVRLPSPCPSDLNDDDATDGADLGLLLADWGRTSSPADLNEDGTVDGADLGLLLAGWGPCG